MKKISNRKNKAKLSKKKLKAMRRKKYLKDLEDEIFATTRVTIDNLMKDDL